MLEFDVIAYRVYGRLVDNGEWDLLGGFNRLFNIEKTDHRFLWLKYKQTIKTYESLVDTKNKALVFARKKFEDNSKDHKYQNIVIKEVNEYYEDEISKIIWEDLMWC